MSIWGFLGDAAGGAADGLVSGAYAGAAIREQRRRANKDALTEAEMRRRIQIEEQERQLSDQQNGIVRGTTTRDPLPTITEDAPLFEDIRPGMARNGKVRWYQLDNAPGPARLGGVGMGMQGSEAMPDLQSVAHEELINQIGDRPRQLIPYSQPFAYRDPDLLREQQMRDPEVMAAASERDLEYQSRAQFDARRAELARQNPEYAQLFELAENEDDLRQILTSHVDGFETRAERNRADSSSASGAAPKPDMTLKQAMDTLKSDLRYYDFEGGGVWRFSIDEIRAEARRLMLDQPLELPAVMPDDDEDGPSREMATEEEVRAGYVTTLNGFVGMDPEVKKEMRAIINDETIPLRSIQRIMANYLRDDPGEDGPALDPGR